MLKILERQLDTFLREETFVRYLLQESQHAYRTGKSTETALRSLVTKTESSTQEKQYVSVIFMDIQGASNSTTFVASDVNF